MQRKGQSRRTKRPQEPQRNDSQRKLDISGDDKREYEERISGLGSFRDLVKRLIATASGTNREMQDLMVALGESPQFFADEALRTEANQSIPTVRRYLEEVGQLPIYTSYPAPAVGGPIVKVDLLENMFVEDIWSHGRHPALLLDNIDRAIGAYKDLLASGETIAQRDVQSGFTLVSSFQQHLRPLVRKSPKHEMGGPGQSRRSLERTRRSPFKRSRAVPIFLEELSTGFCADGVADGPGGQALQARQCAADHRRDKRRHRGVSYALSTGPFHCLRLGRNPG